MTSRTSPWGDLSPGMQAGQRKATPIKPGSRTDRKRKQAENGVPKADSLPIRASHTPLPDVDGRSAFSRRKRTLIAAFISDLGDEVSTAERILADKAATLTLQMRALEARMDEGDVSSGTLDLYGRACGHLVRMLRTLGIERRRDLTPEGRQDALLELYRIEGKLPEGEIDE